MLAEQQKLVKLVIWCLVLAILSSTEHKGEVS